MGALTESNNLADVLKGEAPNQRSREEIVILAGSGAERSIPVGTVLGKRTNASATSAADAGNTGNGVMGAVTMDADVQTGVYTLTCTAAASNAGTFEVQGPDGKLLADMTVAVAYTDQLNFTLADGAADFVVTDKFYITVGDGKFTALDFTKSDGSQVAAGFAFDDYTAADGTDGVGVAIVREAIASDLGLVWPTGATDGQKAAAIGQLEALGILVREGV